MNTNIPKQQLEFDIKKLQQLAACLFTIVTLNACSTPIVETKPSTDTTIELPPVPPPIGDIVEPPKLNESPLDFSDFEKNNSDFFKLLGYDSPPFPELDILKQVHNLEKIKPKAVYQEGRINMTVFGAEYLIKHINPSLLKNVTTQLEKNMATFEADLKDYIANPPVSSTIGIGSLTAQGGGGTTTGPVTTYDPRKEPIRTAMSYLISEAKFNFAKISQYDTTLIMPTDKEIAEVFLATIAEYNTHLSDYANAGVQESLFINGVSSFDKSICFRTVDGYGLDNNGVEITPGVNCWAGGYAKKGMTTKDTPRYFPNYEGIEEFKKTFTQDQLIHSVTLGNNTSNYSPGDQGKQSAMYNSYVTIHELKHTILTACYLKSRMDTKFSFLNIGTYSIEHAFMKYGETMDRLGYDGMNLQTRLYAGIHISYLDTTSPLSTSSLRAKNKDGWTDLSNYQLTTSQAEINWSMLHNGQK
jgi:hypothetical protein